MRKRLAAGAVVALSIGTFVLLRLPEAVPPAAAVPLDTADLTRETLIDRENHDGSLGHGDAVTIASRAAGTVTWLPPAGNTIGRGRALYRLDNEPIIVLYGKLPAYRELRPGVEGADVTQFERNLRALGYRGFTVDDAYTSATASAVRDWQDDLGVTETGRVGTGRIAYAASSVRIEALKLPNGSVVQPGTELLTVTGTSLVATVELDMDSQRLAIRGAKVAVTLPDGTTVPGKIAEVGTTVQEGQGDQADTTLIKVTVSFTAAPAGLDDAAVTVAFTAAQRKDVLTVPVAALLARAEGGYGVQVVDGANTRIVAVETGLFADGKVEIEGAGLAAGMKVGMPA
jgi:peptidoglycan hydrolase-like protein with peptidoglycan-binding domain